MKNDCRTLGIKKLCALFGKTRHAYYDKEWQLEEKTIEYAVVLKLVDHQKKIMPRIGTPKIYELIKGDLEKHNIKLGRDKLHELLSFYDLTVKKKRRRTVTTMSRHWLKKYPNLIRDLEVLLPEELWVADITYITLDTGFCYLSLITDAYSRKIVGYCLSKTLEHYGPLEALKYALSQRQYPKHPLIHHSDRGIQYCCKEYVSCLFDRTIKISMTEKGDPYENAIAERVNGILKDEFYLDRTFKSYEQALLAVKEAVDVYNNFRPHASCNYLTPEKAHQKNGPLKHRWKKYPKTTYDREKVF